MNFMHVLGLDIEIFPITCPSHVLFSFFVIRGFSQNIEILNIVTLTFVLHLNMFCKGKNIMFPSL
jgi:hypothetical protein